MSERFVVDFRIAAAERDTLFTPDWCWPVSQSLYDDPLRDFVEWAYTLPAEISRDERLRTAYELIEADLLKDISSIVGTWFDVSTARQQGLNLVYSPDQLLFRMLDLDQFENFSPTQENRVAAESSALSRSRKTSRWLRKRVRTIKSGLRLIPSELVVGGNTLTAELTGGGLDRIRHTYADLATQRTSSIAPPQDMSDLARTIQQNLLHRLDNTGHPATTNFAKFIDQLVLNYMEIGWHDAQFVPEVSPKPNMTLFTGTGGGYLARVISNAFQRNGASVVRTTHGGETALFNDPLWPSIELPFANSYVTYGSHAAARIDTIAQRHVAVRNQSNAISVVANGSSFHNKIVEASTPAQQISNVYVISASFSGLHREIPHLKIHDIVYYEWHRRLLHTIKSCGFNTFAKRHPKGVGSSLEMFEDVANRELRQTSMADTFGIADAYVIDIAGSAFIEAMCTLKPVVLIDIPNRRMTDEARSRIGESAQIIRADSDDRNRVTIDDAHNKIREALMAPVNQDARRRFIKYWLTSTSN